MKSRTGTTLLAGAMRSLRLEGRSVIINDDASATPHLGVLTVMATSVLADLLSSDELEQVRVARQLGGSNHEESEVLLFITACGEESIHYLWRVGQVQESGDELRARVASELQDFISESGFGWSQQRPWPPGQPR